MIEINLIPDVKQELINAQRFRNVVISVSIIAALVSAGLVVLLAIYVFGVQGLLNNKADGDIQTKFSSLQSVKDLDKALTLQNQLGKAAEAHAKVNINSRVFDVLSTIVTSSNNQVSVTNFVVNADEKTITIEGEAPSGYQALDAFKKTILATKFQYQTTDDTSLKTVTLTSQISDGERSYSQDSEGKNTLRFTLSFIYADPLLSRDSINGKIIAPSVTNATDSVNEVPSSIFSRSSGEDK